MADRCSHCGGISFHADRALSWRLVCTTCGTPSSERGASIKLLPRNKSKKFILILLAVLVVIIILR